MPFRTSCTWDKELLDRSPFLTVPCYYLRELQNQYERIRSSSLIDPCTPQVLRALHLPLLNSQPHCGPLTLLATITLSTITHSILDDIFSHFCHNTLFACFLSLWLLLLILFHGLLFLHSLLNFCFSVSLFIYSSLCSLIIYQWNQIIVPLLSF